MYMQYLSANQKTNIFNEYEYVNKKFKKSDKQKEF